MESLVWNIDPEIFRIGSFAPRYYGLLFAIGFLVGYHFMKKMFLEEGRDEESLSSLLFHIMVGTIVGARLGHCLFYEPGYYLRNPLEILMIWKGGLASHGGTIGVIIAVWLYKRKHPDQGFFWLADRLAVGVAFTAGCIRLGNFFNSEILGKPTNLPWGIVFQKVDNIARHPAMLYESLSYFVLFGVLWFLYRRKGAQLREGKLIGLLFIWVFTSRFFIEFVKENQVSFENQLPLNMGQLLSIPFIILGFILYSGIYQKWIPTVESPKDTRKTKPGKTLKSKKRKGKSAAR